MTGLTLHTHLRVGTLQPFLEGLVDGRAPETELVTGGAELALLLHLEIADSPGHVVIGSKEHVSPRWGAIQTVGHNPWRVRVGQARGRVQVAVSDLVAEIAKDSLGLDTRELVHVGGERRGRGRAGRMTVGAIAGCARKVELVAREDRCCGGDVGAIVERQEALVEPRSSVRVLLPLGKGHHAMPAAHGLIRIRHGRVPFTIRVVPTRMEFEGNGHPLLRGYHLHSARMIAFLPRCDDDGDSLHEALESERSVCGANSAVAGSLLAHHRTGHRPGVQLHNHAADRGPETSSQSGK